MVYNHKDRHSTKKAGAKAFKAESLELPVFEEVRGGFMATIKREKFTAIQKGKNFVKDFVKDFAKDLSERQKVILELINDNPFISAKDMSEKMSEKTSINERAIERDIAKLKKNWAFLRANVVAKMVVMS